MRIKPLVALYFWIWEFDDVTCTHSMWLPPRAGKMNQILCCDWLPERASWGYLAHLGLLAVSRKKNFSKSHIINPVLSKIILSKWVSFLFVDLDFVSFHKHAKYNLANIQPSWPHTWWSITHMYTRTLRYSNWLYFLWRGRKMRMLCKRSTVTNLPLIWV